MAEQNGTAHRPTQFDRLDARSHPAVVCPIANQTKPSHFKFLLCSSRHPSSGSIVAATTAIPDFLASVVFEGPDVGSLTPSRRDVPLLLDCPHSSGPSFRLPTSWIQLGRFEEFMVSGIQTSPAYMCCMVSMLVECAYDGAREPRHGSHRHLESCSALRFGYGHIYRLS